MLLTTRAYHLAQSPYDPGAAGSPFIQCLPTPRQRRAAQRHAEKMLLLHQTGSVKVGEVVRYTLSYHPAADRILPSPPCLHLRIKNTSAIPLRAAYLHGPYCLHVAAYPSVFDPNHKLEHPRKYGVPQFEPMLKAGGVFNAKLTVPDDIRVTGHTSNVDASQQDRSVTWIIEVTSQILFSASASVHYEILVSRDERSLDYSFHAVPGHGSHSQGGPGRVQDHQEGKRKHQAAHPAQPKGVYSRAVTLVVEDTTRLWDKPKLPARSPSAAAGRRSRSIPRRGSSSAQGQQPKPKKKKKIHLVVLTHGLHSNLSADMLYLKESIDATAKQAREARKLRRMGRDKLPSLKEEKPDPSTAPLSGGQEDLKGDPDIEGDEDDEQIIVRGFGDNATRTENGIQYLGKRMARWLLDLTYPDQPFRPVKRSTRQKVSDSLHSSKTSKDDEQGAQVHENSTIREDSTSDDLPYTFTSISFIGHSLGGLVQLYALGYIQKHAPHFFEQIKPVNFVALASPLLGLSNENPLYVKFALDFGLVGRTGQDLGLTWRPPTLAKSGWGAVMGGLGSGQKGHAQEDPGAKPLLRILPTGPAHRVLRMFRNRTVYSNVVNDGIVPLRTSCLLFLDWRGLEKVEKARRENGLIGTMAEWGWAEITGQNIASLRSSLKATDEDDSHDSGDEERSSNHIQSAVPQPAENATNDREENATAVVHSHSQFSQRPSKSGPISPKSMIDEMWNWIRPSGKTTKNDLKMFRRSQTLQTQLEEASPSPVAEQPTRESPMNSKGRPMATRGDSIIDDPAKSSNAPPKTTIFESAGDILNPPIPPLSWIIDPSTRSRTIFHDRVYHPEDIPPPPPVKRASRFGQSFSSDGTQDSTLHEGTAEPGSMRVEEKIARAYHKDLSWRKVLVRLEPDAHNNMIVRRMFANAYGWPVVKHLCDTHFGDTYTATTRDEQEPAFDRAKPVEQPIGEKGERVNGQESATPPPRPHNELREEPDELAPLRSESEGPSCAAETPSSRPPTAATFSSLARTSTDGSWEERYFRDTDDEDDGPDERGPLTRFINPPLRQRAGPATRKKPTANDDDDYGLAYGTSQAVLSDFLTASPPPIEGHRGLAPKVQQPASPSSARSTTVAGGGPNAGSRPSSVGSPPRSPSSPVKGTGRTLGLRSSLEDPTLPAIASGSVAEQVARNAAKQPKH